jgi:hypothetical protein
MDKAKQPAKQYFRDKSPTQSESMYGEGSLIALGMIHPTPKLKIHQSEDQSIIPKFSQV